jgi:Cd2+/Zn2+-exporting ATPase
MDSLSNLTAIGFTEYEARVYLALLSENPATGYQISKNTGVPRSMVYEALGRLHARGAVLKTGDRRVTLIRPVPPDILLERYESEHRSLLKNLQANLSELYNAPEEERLWSISDSNTVLAYAKQMLEGAKTEILLVLNDSHIDTFGSEIQTACEAGVALSAVLTGEKVLSCGQSVRHPPLESELQELTDMLVVIVDDHECLIANTKRETAATITTNRNLVFITKQFVWMEIFTQRIYTQLGLNLLEKLDPADRRIFESFSPSEMRPD